MASSNYLNPIEIAISSSKFIPALKSIAEYLKLIESLDTKINRLINTPLNAALESIKCAKNSKGKNQEEHLRDAVREFKTLIRLENKSFDNAYRLLIIYYGYAMCLYQLKDYENAIIKLKEYANLDLNPSFRKQTIVQRRTLLIITSSFAFGIVVVPLYKLNEFKKINIIDNIFKKVNEWILYGFKQKEALVRQSQDKAVKFAQEIEEIASQNNFQKIFSKKERKLFEKLSEYFNILQNNIINV